MSCRGFHSSDEDESPAFLPDTTSSSSDGEEALVPHAVSAPIAIPAAPVRPRPPPSPLVQRNAKRSLGQKQLCKRGRRSRQRFDEERRMLAQFVDPEDEEEAFTLVRESNSHFRVRRNTLGVAGTNSKCLIIATTSSFWKTRLSWTSS